MLLHLRAIIPVVAFSGGGAFFFAYQEWCVEIHLPLILSL